MARSSDTGKAPWNAITLALVKRSAFDPATLIIFTMMVQARPDGERVLL
jgi:hypothetical protein